MRARMHGWSLVELLVVLSITAILLGVLLPALAASRQTAKQVNCLANLRSLGQAHAVYLNDSSGLMLGTTHSTSWIEVLRGYDPAVLLRSPIDTSPHFAGGLPINGAYRQTSYSINRYLSPDFIDGASRIETVPRPEATVHFGIKVFEQRPGDPSDDRPLWDHFHADGWSFGFNPPASNASDEMQINAYRGDLTEDDAVSGYGYLDGHAEAQAFSGVYVDAATNRFDYRVAR
ncbi:MAG: type II secretion system protein [Planctomycetota bacterium]